MSFWDRFKWKKVVEHKAFDLDWSSIPGAYDAMFSLGWYPQAAAQALRYYSSTAPLATAIDRTASEFANMPPVLWDGDEYLTDVPIVDLLRSPNPEVSGASFLATLAVHYPVTGNAYVLALGLIDREPVELRTINPSRVQYDPHKIEYEVNHQNGMVERFIKREIRGHVQWVNGEGRELMPVSVPNTTSDYTPIAPSPLNALYYELEQYLQASQHNTSQLKRGGKPGLVMSLDKDVVLKDEQRKQLLKEISAFYDGSANSGRAIVLNGAQTIKDMGQTNKDMDFRELRNDMTTTIYNRLGFPLPLVNAENMTLSNFDSARVALYDAAVFPLAEDLYLRLTNKLGWRFGLVSGERLTYDPASIPATRTRNFEEAKTLSSIGVVSTNEVRAILGYENIGIEGDAILAPANLVPIGEDQDTETNRDSAAEKTYTAALGGQLDKNTAKKIWLKNGI